MLITITVSDDALAHVLKDNVSTPTEYVQQVVDTVMTPFVAQGRQVRAFELLDAFDQATDNDRTAVRAALRLPARPTGRVP